MKKVFLILSFLTIFSSLSLWAHPLYDLQDELKDYPYCLVLANIAIVTENYKIDWEDIKEEERPLLAHALDSYLDKNIQEVFKIKADLSKNLKKEELLLNLAYLKAQEDYERFQNYQLEVAKNWSKSF